MKIKTIAFSILVVCGITGALSGCNNSNNNSVATNSYNFGEKVDSADNKVDNSNKISDLSKEKEDSENSTNKSKEYEIINKTYNKNSVKINYPQIKNLTDSKKLNLINKELEEEALCILDSYLKDDTNLNQLTMDINYEVKLKNDKYISVVYTGYSNSKESAYPLSVFYTTNIDMEKGSSIRLSDYANITDILNKLKDSNNVTVLLDNKEVAEIQKVTLSNIDDTELRSMLEDADFYKVNGKVEHPKQGSYSYMDDDNIVVSLEVIHAMGDHAEFEVKK